MVRVVNDAKGIREATDMSAQSTGDPAQVRRHKMCDRGQADPQSDMHPQQRARGGMAGCRRNNPINSSVSRSNMKHSRKAVEFRPTPDSLKVFSHSCD